jgi:RNA polymerase sigma factor (sigma-70 family)
MPDTIPSYLAELLSAPDPTAAEHAWERFVARVTPLILSVTRARGTGYDEGMDCYAFVLDHLRRDDFKRLRTYTPDSKCQFTTWLVVVCRRLCVDHQRQLLGRVRAGTDVIKLQQRRSLTQSLFSSDEFIESLPAPEEEAPDRYVEERELSALVDACLNRLPAADKLLLKLKYEDSLGAAEIQRIMRLPTPFHVYRRINRVLESLRLALSFTKAEPVRQSEAARPLNRK